MNLQELSERIYVGLANYGELKMQMVGKRIRIRPIRRSDLALVLPWWNDPEVMYYADDDPCPSKTLKELKEQYEKEKREWQQYMERFIIETLDGQPIGDIMYRGYRSDIRSAYMGLFIGVKSYWGQGYGTEAIRLFLGYLFEHKKLHKIAITVSDFNTRAIRAYRKCGFRQDGVLRDNAIVDGKYVDHIVMSILEDEYAQLNGGKGVGSHCSS